MVSAVLAVLMLSAVLSTASPAGATLLLPPGDFDLECPADSSHPFTDVSPSDFSALHAGCLFQLGLLNGTSATTMSPNDVLTREQAAALIARLWRAAGNDCPDAQHPFVDVVETSFADADISCIFALGITTGTSDTTFSPADEVTRAQMASFLIRLWRALGGACDLTDGPFDDVAPALFAHDDIDCLFNLAITTGTSATTFSPSNAVTRAQMVTFIGRMINRAAVDLIDAESLRLMSFNVRFDNPSDEPNWGQRLNPILNMLAATSPDIIGTQEALDHQVDDLATGLPGYAWIGVGRDDGVDAGEYAAIFYRSDTFAVVDSGTFWLSDTPGTPSVGWDAALERIVTWAEFSRIGSDETFFVLNTHFDHEGQTARVNSATQIQQWIEANTDDKPTFVLGDLNVLPNDPVMGDLLSDLGDSRTRAIQTDNVGSFNAFLDPTGIWSIDYILFSEGTPSRFETIDDNYGVSYISDHFPIIADISCAACG